MVFVDCGGVEVGGGGSVGKWGRRRGYFKRDDTVKEVGYRRMLVDGLLMAVVNVSCAFPVALAI